MHEEPEWRIPPAGPVFVPPGEKPRRPIFVGSGDAVFSSKCGQYRHENQKRVKQHEGKCRQCR